MGLILTSLAFWHTAVVAAVCTMYALWTCVLFVSYLSLLPAQDVDLQEHYMMASQVIYCDWVDQCSLFVTLCNRLNIAESKAQWQELTIREESV